MAETNSKNETKPCCSGEGQGNLPCCGPNKTMKYVYYAVIAIAAVILIAGLLLKK